MRTSNKIPDSVDVVFVATFDSVADLVDKTAAAAPIAEDYKCGLSDDNGSANGSRNKRVDEVMLNVVSASSCKSYNSVNKVILQYCFEADNNHRAALTELALELLGQYNLQRYSKKMHKIDLRVC